MQELEALADAMRKEVSIVRKINVNSRELKPLGLSCQKKMWSIDGGNSVTNLDA
ncbi:hypothetical protein Syun_028253 [Stephania yunnanensis]|uniref:Uncharacterized protein n=1 Tax=Stephania yunnanensis TaxID=152371 RepID=A0AAP0HQN8_9MAGN